MGLFDKMMGYANAFKRDAGVSDAETAGAAKQSPREQGLLREFAAATDVVTARFRYTWLFSGAVQSVGFRWTNQGLARERGLTGWIRNLDDGTVEGEIQGPPAAIAAHLGRLHAYYSRFGNTIWLERADELPCVDGEQDLEVRY